MLICTFCLSRFRDDTELMLLRDGDQMYWGCPDCRTDEYLEDMPDEEEDEE